MIFLATMSFSSKTVVLCIMSKFLIFAGAHPFKGYTQYRKSEALTGLVAEGRDLTLNGDKLRILSGTIHYFRVPQEHWRHRLELLKANGLNTIETYVPWNIHEPGPNIFDFGGPNGTDNLDIRKYIGLAKDLNLLVLLRPGPYICAEWDYGGLPSWLLSYPNMQVRTTNADYLARTAIFYQRLHEEIWDLQFTNGKGPIIALQIENEYGAYGNDTAYKMAVMAQLRTAGFSETLFTSDGPQDLVTGSLPNVWMTVNGRDYINATLGKLRTLQPNKPLMVMEYWTGWFTHWKDPHNLFHGVLLENFTIELRAILDENASLNFYMYHGGTNFGFLNGANTDEAGTKYAPDVTSYDYDSLVSEAGVLTAKGVRTKEILKVHGLFPDGVGDGPPAPEFAAYGEKVVNEWLPLDQIKTVMNGRTKLANVVPMEQLRYKKGAEPDEILYGQSYGYIIYDHVIENQDGDLVVEEFHDRAMIFLDGRIQRILEFTESTKEDHVIQLKKLDSTNQTMQLTILVENLGRVNYARDGLSMDNMNRGLMGTVKFDDHKLNDWEIFPMEFTAAEVSALYKLQTWKNPSKSPDTPAAFRVKFSTPEAPKDTFLNVNNWGKGVVFVNGRCIGRYWPSTGPQKTLYVPGPWLRAKGEENDVILFELEKYGGAVGFQKTHDLGSISAT